MKKLRLSFLLSFLLMGGIAFGQAPANDMCAGSIDLTSFLGQGNDVEVNAGLYTNQNATTDPSDPADGWECYGEPDGGGAAPTLENTVWFSFVGDGNLYFIESGECADQVDPIEDGDTQFSLYSGMCDSLTAVICNEDGPSATGTFYPAGLSVLTEVGVTYYLMVDGFSFNGANSDGDFCLYVTQKPVISCGDSTISSGEIVPIDPVICYGDIVVLDVKGIGVPNGSPMGGFAMVVSTEDISGSTNPAADPSFWGNYGIQEGIDSIMYAMPNDDSQLNSNAVWYFTPVTYGNATGSGSNTFGELVYDTTCVHTGTSQMVTFLPEFGAGTATSTQDSACMGDTIMFNVDNILGFPVGTNSGVGFIASLTNSPSSDIHNDSTIVWFSGVDSVPSAPGTNMMPMIYDSTMMVGTFYITPVLFVNGGMGTELETVDLNGACVHLGNSVAITFMDETSGFCTGVGVDGIPQGFAVSELYPVPTTNKVNVEFTSPNFTSVNVTIIDQLGKVVFVGTEEINAGKNYLSFDVNEFSNGIYFVKVDHEKFTVTEKFIKE